jgi:hypothetical protein
VEEPTTRDPPLPVAKPWPMWRGGFILWLSLLTVATVLGIWILAENGKLLLPFERIHALPGAAASKADYLEDKQVQRILLGRGIKIVLTRTGSREIAVDDLKEADFAFPSGAPAARLITAYQHGHKLRAQPYRPFVSPLVLGSFREYADALVKANIATPIGDARQTLYYSIKMGDFLKLMRQGKSWNDLWGKDVAHPRDGRKIQVRTSDLCTSNGAATYMSLVAWVEGGGQVAGPEDAVPLAEKIRSLLPVNTLADNDLFLNYAAPEGPNFAAIATVYEHQYLGYQMERQATGRGLDRSRVLLYPDPQILTQPELIALKGELADEFGRLLLHDPQLRTRAAELGFRLLDMGGLEQADSLNNLLRKRGVPVPAVGTVKTDEDQQNPNPRTTADLPTPEIIEKMISRLLPYCPKAPR